MLSKIEYYPRVDVAMLLKMLYFIQKQNHTIVINETFPARVMCDPEKLCRGCCIINFGSCFYLPCTHICIISSSRKHTKARTDRNECFFYLSTYFFPLVCVKPRVNKLPKYFNCLVIVEFLKKIDSSSTISDRIVL